MPFFVADLYEQDLGPSPNFAALAADPRIVGVILKATQGVQYAPAWFQTNWGRARVCGIRGAYHFGMPISSGAQQADFFLAAIAAAGGFSGEDMPAIWDLEGSIWTSSQQIIDRSSEFSARILERTGKRPLLYAGATIRDNQITDHMGFDGLYTPHLDMSRAGWPLSSYKLWQYAGDGKLYNPASAAYGFPTSIPGWGGTDMSVVMDGGVFAASRDAARGVLIGGWSWTTLLLLGAAAALLYLSM